MMRKREEAWVIAFLGFAIAVAQLLQVRTELWPRLGVLDWLFLAILLIAPLLNLRRHLRGVTQLTNDVYATSFLLTMGTYLPLWFGLGLVRKVLH